MKITLVGNYAPDEQQSMLRYSTMLHEGLLKAGHDVRLVLPTHRLSRAGIGGLRKWIGYVDKFVLTWSDLKAAQRDAEEVAADAEENAAYARAAHMRRVVEGAKALAALKPSAVDARVRLLVRLHRL